MKEYRKFCGLNLVPKKPQISTLSTSYANKD